MSGPLISVENLTVEIKTDRGLLKAIRGVSFDINPGDSIGIVGESGSGKSITLKAILGLLPSNAHISSGKIIVEGKDISTLDHKSRRALLSHNTGMIFQDAIAALNPVIKIGDQITEVPRYRLGKSKEDSKAIALSIMAKVGITDAETRYGLYP